MTEDAIEPLSRFVAGLRFDAIPAEAVRAAKTFLVDSFGVALAGSSAPGVGVVRDQLREWGGAPEATVERLLGTPEQPMSWGELLAKFWHCAGYAASPVPRERLERLLALVEEMERLPDVHEVVSCLVA